MRILPFLAVECVRRRTLTRDVKPVDDRQVVVFLCRQLVRCVEERIYAQMVF